MSVVISILAAIGLMVIISYVVYYLYKYYKNIQIKQTIAEMNPPDNYMQTIGLQCPDYWVNTGIDSNGNYTCKNQFNVPSTCSGGDLSFMSIPSKNTWEYGNPNNLNSMSDYDKYTFLNNKGTGSYSRCDWVNKCGSDPNTQGIWQGVNEICSSPPPSS
jgi:hypothetical protein